MISRLNGDVDFIDGLHLCAQQPLDRFFADAVGSRPLPVPGWKHYEMGPRISEHGEFEVGVVCGPETRLYLVLMSHRHAFYQWNTKEDSERRAFHEGILARDLSGQREFSWGQAFCRFDFEENRNRLVVAYTLGPQVPSQPAWRLFGLEEVKDEQD